MESRTLADRLRQEGHLDADQIELASEGGHGSFEEAVVRLGFCDEAELVRLVCRSTHTPSVDLTAKTVEPEVLALVSAALVQKHRCLPLFVGASPGRSGGRVSPRGVLFLGVENPLAQGPLVEVSRATGLEARPVVVGPVQLTLAMERFYPLGLREGLGTAADSLVAGDTAPLVGDPDPILPAQIETEAAEAPESASHADPDEEDGRRREVPTRIILQALTKLLVANDLIDRDELMSEVAATKQREDGSTSD